MNILSTRIINEVEGVQGTIYPDVIESSSKKSKSDVIKSGHDVGGLPKNMKFNLVEPIFLKMKLGKLVNS